MASTYIVVAILVWSLLHSNHSVRGTVAPTNEALVSYSRNISVSSRYHNAFTGKRLPHIPRNSQEQILDDHPNNLVTHTAGALANYYKFTSVLASLSVHGVPLKASQSSEAIVSLSIGEDGPPEQVEAISFGWHVDPQHYGDNDTHFFISWTKNGFKSRCLNLECEGFIVDKQSPYRPGNKLKPVSERNGKQYYMTARIAREPIGWYIYQGSDWHHQIGYWPVEFFNKLWDYGTRVVVGGSVVFPRGEPSPPMGSGFRPSDPNGKAAMIRVLYKNDKGVTVPLIGGLFADRKDCYSISGSNGNYYFGGPGGCTN